MKISQMKAEQAADALIRITDPVSRILNDEEVEKLVKDFAKAGGKTPIKVIAELLPRVVPVALKKHREDVFEIVGALSDKSAVDVAGMPFIELMTVIRDSVDKELIDFFKTPSNQEKQAEKE